MSKSKPNYLWSLFTMKCPRCRRGSMFSNPNPWNLKETLKMPAKCPECGQHFELEVGFWYGTGYVSYVLTVVFSMLSFAAWWFTIGFSISDNRFFWWLGINSVVMILLQPWFMQFSRALYLYFFVSYDENYNETAVKSFDYSTGQYYRKEDDLSK